MPLDNTREHPHQRLMDLEDRLRRRDFSFSWNYEGCETCALAINVEAHGLVSYKEIGRYYGISCGQAESIFCELRREDSIRYVTVDDVCGQIRKVLEKVLV